ncbi:hypothetical protein BDV95DRAFT_581819 [Massariosphaeria phaeospora]|uniref:Uncharacterized protein n=1 Tax=Massariosphaeria phaeospora TaxID=100035 RepID=A0A7C8I5J4_9PLEO|nr:hypothetical protein BDV95DRAFT_581819 [Massariosphaeria phaeospora]
MYRNVVKSYMDHSPLVPISVPRVPISIPRYSDLIQATDPFWRDNLRWFPAGFSACRALVSERIPKVPRAISDKIVNLFCAGNESVSEIVKHNDDDDACLIRVYLGRRRRRAVTNSSRL